METDIDSEAFRILEEKFPDTRNEAYAIVFEQIGRFIEQNKLRRTEFPQLANSAMNVLALALAKKNLATKYDEAEKYLKEQLTRIRSSGFTVVEEIFKEVSK